METNSERISRTEESGVHSLETRDIPFELLTAGRSSHSGLTQFGFGKEQLHANVL